MFVPGRLSNGRSPRTEIWNISNGRSLPSFFPVLIGQETSIGKVNRAINRSPMSTVYFRASLFLPLPPSLSLSFSFVDVDVTSSSAVI